MSRGQQNRKALKVIMIGFGCFIAAVTILLINAHQSDLKMQKEQHIAEIQKQKEETKRLETVKIMRKAILEAKAREAAKK